MALPKSREAKKVNLDFNKEFISTFTQNIESGNVEFINQTLKDLHEADVANLIENLSSQTLIKKEKMGTENLQNRTPNPPKSRPNGAKRGPGGPPNRKIT